MAIQLRRRRADRASISRAVAKAAFVSLSGVFLMAQAAEQLDNKPPPIIPKSPPIGTQEERRPTNELQRGQPPITTQGDIIRRLDIENMFRNPQARKGEKIR